MNDERKINFKRLASKRTNEILKKIKILGNCANRSHYDYTEEEIAKIFAEIERRLREAKAKFSFPNKDKEFKL